MARMRATGLWTAATACMALLAGCGGAGDEASRTAPAISPAPTAAPVSGTGATAPAAGDAAVLGVLAAIDGNVIALTEHALARRPGGTTETFAAQMHDAHRQALAQARRLGAADQDAAAQAVRARGQGAVKALEAETDENAYRNAFMAAITAEYAKALKTLDAELIPGARSEPVRSYLQQQRRQLAEHYERAQAVISSR